MPRTATLPDRPVRRKKKLPPKAATVLEEVLTLEEAAAYLRVSPADVDDLAAHQDLPGRKIGNQWRFHKAALADWLGRLSARDRLMHHAGAAKDDPNLDEMLRTIYERRASLANGDGT